MQFSRKPSPITQTAFTLVEIVLSLAIVAVALVAIIGVLPLGLNVDRSNREDSIINQEATLWMEALRGGSEYMALPPVDYMVLTENGVVVDGFEVVDPAPTNVLKLVSTISDTVVPNVLNQNQGNPPAATRLAHVRARAVNGNLSELQGDTNFAFGYQLEVEVSPHYTGPGSPYLNVFNTNQLYDVRLEFNWPLVPPDDRIQTDFARSKTFRSIVYASRNSTNFLLQFVQPQ